ncbi:glycoside hydrolase family 17 protein [Methylovorus glucosotrophus]|jgi:exo-beta-1,3-glucanase (GH17 family)|uniref:Endo-1,3-beta-glucanase btgC n=1 Tax=Methylovorus glucosotrophus (strain SIP3-4) TaxID=582744 RepID=C6XD99_METGS|nr:beta-1,6-glucan synthase [Methylovorus glucosotrophus]ACT50524.1 putative beta (1-6) glucan synthase [Methylovorus glucosotrophus SIP3-4]
MPNVSTPRLWIYSIFNLSLLVLLGAWLWSQNKPVNLTEATLPESGKLQCVSYAPYYGKDQTPFIKGTVISRQQIDRDLELLAKRSECVRIYSVSQGLDYVPEAAARLGLKVLMGAWIGADKIENDREVALAIKLANEYPQAIRAMVIGNEVLLRKEQTAEQLKAYFDQVKAATHVPITYADVWEFWLKHKELESSVDFVTVHVLPYWEDDPQPIERAISHATGVMQRLQASFTKPLLIGETGWPSVGRQRNGSVPSLLNQAEYIRAFVSTAQHNGWQYNVIEAMDQPWKRELEGAVGGYWGLYTTDLEPKFPFNGPVSERHDQPAELAIWLAAGAVILILFTLLADERRLPALIGSGLLGALAGLSAKLQWQYLIEACRNTLEWSLLGGITIAGILLLIAIPTQFKRQSDSGNKLIKLCMWLIAIGVFTCCMLSLPTLQIVNIFGLTDPFATRWLFEIDGRYRDFPLPLYALPVIQLAIGLTILNISRSNTWRPYKAINLLALAAMVACIAFETENRQAIAWLLLVLATTYATWPRTTLLHKLKTLNA